MPHNRKGNVVCNKKRKDEVTCNKRRRDEVFQTTQVLEYQPLSIQIQGTTKYNQESKKLNIAISNIQDDLKIMIRTSTSRKIVKKMIDLMELLWDTKIMTHNKNPKGTAEGKCLAFSPNHISHAPMGSGLMYFIPHKCFLIPKLIELVKCAFDPITRIARDLQGNAILNLDPSSVASAFNPPLPMSTPISVNWDMIPNSNIFLNIIAWLNRNMSKNGNFTKFSNAEVPLSKFSSHL